VNYKHNNPSNYVGVTSYLGIFSHEEMLEIERKAFKTEKKCF